jgi:outer membrane protein
MSGRLTHVAMALLTAASLVVSPVYAQAQGGQSQDAPQQSQSTSQPQPPPQAPSAVPSTPQALKLSGGPNYSNGKPFFPNVFAPYTPMDISAPPMTNSPRISQLIQDGKLNLSLEDAISLALENNLDISVQRFTPWLAQVNLLRTKAGGASLGTGASSPVLLGSAPAGGFDPILTSSVTFVDETFPVTNPFTSGFGSSSLTSLAQHESIFNFGYSETFHSGTQISLSWDNTRESSTAANIFNPYVQSQLSFTISQPLLAGFGLLPNTRYILEAKNTLKVADAQFAQAVIADVTLVENYYWELVFARENVKVEETTVSTDRQLYENNKKQLEIGTMAPLDVLTAESQLASDQQALVQAQTVKLQDETNLLNSITKNPLDAALTSVEIIPTTPLSTPDVVENLPIESAVKEAWTKRPELQQIEWNLKNDQIEVRATKNGLLPSLTAFGEYSATGLGGNATLTTSTVPTGFVPITSDPIVDANGNPVSFSSPGPIYLGSPIYPTVLKTGGVGDALNSMINAQFPSFIGGLNLTLPIRNRSAQANNAQAQLNERQLEVNYREAQNTVFVNVRNAIIALTQDRAQVTAASKARDLAQQTLDAEQKKFQLGSSTSFNVTLRVQELTAAASNEVRAKANLAEAYVLFNQAMGRTLETNNITLADARTGAVSSSPNIPGWTPTPATPGKK